MRPLSPQLRPYTWALSTVEIARRAGIAPEDVLRFDGNTPPDPPPTARPQTIAAALERIQSYQHGGFPELLRAIAEYNRVEPENVVLGPGADNLLMLCARSYAGPGDRIAIADEPSYPLYRVAAWVTGADVGDVDPVLTFVCRPHNPSGAMVEIPQARPLVVDEAYFEYGGETAVPLIGDGVIVVRTFSKAFGLASRPASASAAEIVDSGAGCWRSFSSAAISVAAIA
jgi:histidinol-phosphate aminotransferase